MPTIQSFDGITLSTVNIIAQLGSAQESSYSSNIGLRQRTGFFPDFESLSFAEKTYTITLIPTSGTSLATFYLNVNRYFSPNGGLFANDRIRVLGGTADDATTTINMDGYITSLVRTGINIYEATFVCPDGLWYGTAAKNTTATPAANGGNARSFPSIEAVVATNCFMQDVTWGMTGGDSADYPILITFSSSGSGATVAANYIVFYNGFSVPFNITGMNTATTKIWMRVNSGVYAEANIFYGSTINNPDANTFVSGGMDLVNSTNTLWRWNDFSLSTFPFATGVWKPAKTGISQSGTSYGLTAESSSTVTFSIEDDDSLQNDADSMVLVVGNAGAGVTNALSGLSRQLILQDSDGIIRQFIRYRTRNSPIWKSAFTESIDSTTIAAFPQVNAAVTAAVDLDNAIEIAVGVEAQEGQPRGGLSLAISAAWTLAVTTPSILITGPVNCVYISSATFVINGDTVYFANVYAINTSPLFVINAKTKTVIFGTGSSFNIGNISFSNPEEWMVLTPGNNTWSWTGLAPTSTTVRWNDGYQE